MVLAKMLERLQFSIPITITIAAPVDIVWDAISDIPSYPSFLSSCVSVEAQPNNATSKGGGTIKSSNKSHASSSDNNNNNIPKDPTLVEQPTTRFLGSRWKITRISVLENQTYEAHITITKHTVTDTSRILTFSTHEMLGATCSLKLIVQKVDAAAIIIDESAHNRGNNYNNNRGGNGGGGGSSERRDSGASAASSTKQQHSSSLLDGREACQMTAIMTMIPYQFFVKLLGVMCCLCLLKWRARIAMECDLEDVTAYCEGKYEEQLKAEELLEEGGGEGGGEGNDDDLGKSAEADAAGGETVESK